MEKEERRRLAIPPAAALVVDVRPLGRAGDRSAPSSSALTNNAGGGSAQVARRRQRPAPLPPLAIAQPAAPRPAASAPGCAMRAAPVSQSGAPAAAGAAGVPVTAGNTGRAEAARAAGRATLGNATRTTGARASGPGAGVDCGASGAPTGGRSRYAVVKVDMPTIAPSARIPRPAIVQRFCMSVSLLPETDRASGPFTVSDGPTAL